MQAPHSTFALVLPLAPPPRDSRECDWMGCLTLQFRGSCCQEALEDRGAERTGSASRRKGGEESQWNHRRKTAFAEPFEEELYATLPTSHFLSMFGGQELYLRD